MAQDFTGTALAGYMIRVVRDVVARNPRWRQTLGEVSYSTNNQVSFGDVQVIIKDIASNGARLSPNNFMCTYFGQAILTQVEDKDGKFIEWTREVDTTGAVLDPGVYYLNVDWVKERQVPAPAAPPVAASSYTIKDWQAGGEPIQTPSDAVVGQVGFTVGKYKWRQGEITNAQGTLIGLAPGIDSSTITVTNQAGASVGVQPATDSFYLLGPATAITVNSGTTQLTPNTQYWVLQATSQVLIQTTVFGSQIAYIPSSYLSVALTDQDGFTLRPGIDYNFVAANQVVLAGWTPANQTITLTGLQKLDPTVAANLMHPENTFNFTLLPGETLAPGQVFIQTQDGTNIQVTPNANGSITLPTPLPPGGYCTYEVRIDAGQTKVLGKRGSIDRNMIPGLWLAVGDQVVPNDQVAVVVSPTVCECYEVFGSKEGVNFTIDVKSNDFLTSSDLSEAIKHEVLVRRRMNMEGDGLTILEMSRTPTGSQRDNSGTATTFTYSIGVTALADWKVYVPLVTRVVSFSVAAVPQMSGYPGAINPNPRAGAFGVYGFLPDYR
jgi:hypothetical protein